MLFGAIRKIRAGNLAEARSDLIDARARYEELRPLAVGHPNLDLAIHRRIQARIDRIVAALDHAPGIEIFDILDAQGRPTGETVSSTIAHLTGARHASVEVAFIDARGRVLLQFRSHGVAIFPGRWTFTATGHVASGKTPREAAIEEIREEVSVAVLPEEQSGLEPEWRSRLRREASGIAWLNFEPRPSGLERIGLENAWDGHLYLYEFIYADRVEQSSMQKTGVCIDPDRWSSRIDGVMLTMHGAASTLSIFTFAPEQRRSVDLGVEVIEKGSAIPPGVLTDNIEKKNLFLYRIDKEEEALLNQILKLKEMPGKPIGDGFASRFEWRDFDELAASFKKQPHLYTDAFIPHLSDPAILASIRERIPRA